MDPPSRLEVGAWEFYAHDMDGPGEGLIVLTLFDRRRGAILAAYSTVWKELIDQGWFKNTSSSRIRPLLRIDGRRRVD